MPVTSCQHYLLYWIRNYFVLDSWISITLKSRLVQCSACIIVTGLYMPTVISSDDVCNIDLNTRWNTSLLLLLLVTWYFVLCSFHIIIHSYVWTATPFISTWNSKAQTLDLQQQSAADKEMAKCKRELYREKKERVETTIGRHWSVVESASVAYWISPVLVPYSIDGCATPISTAQLKTMKVKGWIWWWQWKWCPIQWTIDPSASWCALMIALSLLTVLLFTLLYNGINYY